MIIGENWHWINLEGKKFSSNSNFELEFQVLTSILFPRFSWVAIRLNAKIITEILMHLLFSAGKLTKKVGERIKNLEIQKC